MEITDYIRDTRILPNSKYEFRSKLCLEHIKKGEGVLETIDLGPKQETVLIFREKILKIPRLKYYANGVNSPSDNYLRQIIAFYMHINPLIDQIGIKKMTEYIVRAMVKRVNKKPILKFEDLEHVVKQLAETYRNKMLPKYRSVIVLYSKDTSLTVDERREYSYFVNMTKQRDLRHEIIQLAAEAAIDFNLNNHLIINNPRVFERIADKKTIPSVRSVHRNMSGDTHTMLSIHNNDKYFATKQDELKFKKFLELPGGTSMNDAAKKLKASKSTIDNYNKIRRKLESNER